MSRPRILIVADSPFLDTGFGRVAREIGLGLFKTGLFDIAQLGFFHRESDRLIPYRVYQTQPVAEDAYGKLSYPAVVERFRPHLVLTIGDVWMVSHTAIHPRQHELVGYFPIDSVPVSPKWAMIMRGFDHVVAFGPFGRNGIRAVDPSLQVHMIPHGVDTDIFRPRSDEDRAWARASMCGERSGVNFIVGCVARNQPRKKLSRLFKAWRQFISAATVCRRCGHVQHRHSSQVVSQCPSCGATADRLTAIPAKDDALLYLHTKPDDSQGMNLIDLRSRFGLTNSLKMPLNLEREGLGYSDDVMSRLYSGMDLFTLPTGGEGWGLPILEAMAVGVPCLVTNYSAHLDFCFGAADLIEVSEFETQTHSLGEHALVDIDDYVFRLDRFYYERDAFMAKWQPSLEEADVDLECEAWSTMPFGSEARRGFGEMALSRARNFTWDQAVGLWVNLFQQILPAVDPDDEEPVIDLEAV